MIVFTVLTLLLYAALALAVFYLLFFAVSGHFSRSTITQRDRPKTRFAVLIPAYREDAVIVYTAQTALEQRYPKDLYNVIVIADSLKSSTLNALKRLDIQLVTVMFESSTKAKAINKALDHISDAINQVVILDADNIMHPDCLAAFDQRAQRGDRAIQGHRLAKNLNTPLAILDAISEEINNHLFRRGPASLGLSSALIGSGMSFDCDLFRTIMARIDAIGGFDKMLEFLLVQNGIHINYTDRALVYDEKVQQSEVFVHQRRRWLAAQATYFKRYFFRGMKQFFSSGQKDILNRAIQLALPPRILMLGGLSVLAVLAAVSTFVLQLSIIPPPLWWAGLLLLFVITLALSIPASLYGKPMIQAILHLPGGFVLMLVSLVRSRGANRRFLHTRHGEST